MNAPVELLGYYAAARIAYTLFERREIICVVLETLFSFSFILISIVFLNNCPADLSAGFVFLTYMVTAVVPYLIVRRAPMETKAWHFDKDGKPVVWFGIIDGAWLSIMGATCALIFVGRQLGILDGPMPKPGYSADYYHAAIDISMFFLGFVTTGFLATGAALGGCMAILWAGELWRKNDHKSRSEYQAQTVVSVKMVMAFFTIGVAAAGWAAVPLYNRIIQLQDLMPPLK
jgi:hypothetical protein